jgi:hypothetical protein
VKFGSSQVSGPRRQQSSDFATETEKLEPNLRGCFSKLVWPENATTVLIHNMPSRTSIDELIKAFPPDGSYDLISMRFNVKARRTSGFVSINFVSVDLAEAFSARFHGQHLPHSKRSCKNPLSVTPARIQGLEDNLVKLHGDKGIAEIRNPALLPRLYLSGAAAERLAATAPKSVRQPDALGQPHRLDFEEVLRALNNAEV